MVGRAVCVSLILQVWDVTNLGKKGLAKLGPLIWKSKRLKANNLPPFSTDLRLSTLLLEQRLFIQAIQAAETHKC